MIGFQWLLEASHELSIGTVEGVDDSATARFVNRKGEAAIRTGEF
jgi:hypothetical protein